MLLYSFILFLLSLHLTCAFRALMFVPNSAYSHVEYMGTLADVLVDAGHEVDFVLQVWNPQSKHNGTKKANIIRFEGRPDEEKIKKIVEKISFWNDAFEQDMTHDDLRRFGEISALHCEALLADHSFLNQLRSKHYTVGFFEHFDGCALTVFGMLGVGSLHEMSAIRMPEATALALGLPYDFRHIPVFSNYKQMQPISTFSEVLYNFYEYLVMRFRVQEDQYGATNRLLKRLIDPQHPTVSEMQRRVSYVWLNIYEHMEFKRLSSPKVKQIGGIGIRRPEPLKQEFQQIFNKARKGVVLVSFGSLVNTAYMKPSMRKLLLDTFALFPDYHFIWRFTELNEQIEGDLKEYENVHAFKWLQQTSILAHPHTAAFISHVGCNSLNEAVHFGVPLVAVPFFGDQPLNAALVVKRGNGVFVSRKNISMMRGALEEVLNNKRYKEKALDLKAKITNQPVKPEDLFVKYVEFAERFDVSKDLELESVDDSFCEQFNLDILGLFLFFLILFVFMVWKGLKSVWNCIVVGPRNSYKRVSKAKKEK